MNERTHNNGDRKTIQTLLVDLWRENPGASNAQVVAAVLEFNPNSTYAEHRVQIDRNKYNKAKFKCQNGHVPEVPAFNPERRPMQQSKTDNRQLELAI